MTKDESKRAILESQGLFDNKYICVDCYYINILLNIFYPV